MCVRGAAEHFRTILWYFNMSAFLTGGARLLALMGRGGSAALRGGAAAARGGAAAARGVGRGAAGLVGEAPIGKVGRGISQGIPAMSTIDAATGAVKTINAVSAQEAQRLWQFWVSKGTVKFPKDASKAKNYALEQFGKWGKKNPERLKAISPGLFTRRPGLATVAMNAAFMSPFLLPFLAGGEGSSGEDPEAMLEQMLAEGGGGMGGGGMAALLGGGMGGSNSSNGGMMGLIAGLKNRANGNSYETSNRLAGTQGALKMQGLLDASGSGRPTAFYRDDLQELTRGYDKMLGEISYQEPVTMAEALARQGIIPDQNENRIDFRNML